jgi:AhpD family alkylhydroperoxidase
MKRAIAKRRAPVARPARSRDRLPRSWETLARRYPSVVGEYNALSEACRTAGPLDAATVALVKLAVSVGRGSQRTVHSHAKKALRGGASGDALRHVGVLALPTIGLPAALDSLRWIDESIDEFEAAGG